MRPLGSALKGFQSVILYPLEMEPPKVRQQLLSAPRVTVPISPARGHDNSVFAVTDGVLIRSGICSASNVPIWIGS